MDKIKGYAVLTEEQKQLFDRVYSRHMAAMGTEKRKNYSVEHLKEIKWDAAERCLKVYYKNDDWWHYDTKGDWY